jgi:hypothetical protein
LLATDYRYFHETPRFVFVSHSIGAHLVQRLCVMREDILERTDLLVHLMPFIRFDPCQAHKKTILSTVAGEPVGIENAQIHAGQMPQIFCGRGRR